MKKTNNNFWGIGQVILMGLFAFSSAWFLMDKYNDYREEQRQEEINYRNDLEVFLNDTICGSREFNLKDTTLYISKYQFCSLVPPYKKDTIFDTTDYGD